MKWLWWVAPFVFLFYLLIVSLWPTEEERRLRREAARWLDRMIGPLKTKKGARSRQVKALPAIFSALLREAGGGSRIADMVLVPKRAYLAVRASDTLSGSNHVTVLMRLAKKGPELVCRPLPEVDGRPLENKGVRFPKSPLFMDHYLVESKHEKAARKWLKKAVRSALLELPGVWLRVRGDIMAVTLYGRPDADDIDALVDVADAVFAEYGAGAGESLFGDVPPSRHEEEDMSRASALEPAPVELRVNAGVIDFALFLVGVFFVALTVGAFSWFHPAVLFQSPDLHPSEPWQGGWTTKGFGAFVAAEAFLVGVFALQTYLGSHHGTTIGKLLLGAKVVREDGRAPGFWRTCLRSGALLAVPLAVAALTASRPLTAQSLFEAVPTFAVALSLGALTIAGVALIWFGEPGKGLHDRWSGTQVVRTPPWRPAHVQLGLDDRLLDPVVLQRLQRIGGGMLAFLFVVWLAHATGAWPF